jgi:hypothetical protein
MPTEEHDDLLEYKVAELEKRLAVNEKLFKEFKDAIDAERSRYFLWGIGVLGSMVAALGTTLWNILTTGHPK